MATVLAPQRMEVRRPVVADNHDLAVDQERGGPEMRGSFDDSREAVGPVIAVTGKAADDAGAIPAHHQPIAVVLDFMNPQRAGRWLLRLRRQAWFDEAEGMPHSHSRRLGQRRFNDGLPLVTHQLLHGACFGAVSWFNAHGLVSDWPWEAVP